MMIPEHKKHIYLVILIIISGFILYNNSLNGQFVLDDNILVKDNLYIKNFSNIPKVFTKDIAAGAAEGISPYRPLQMLSYMVDYSLWRLNVTGYHFTNILLHILVALAIYWLINLLCDDKLLSLLTSILFVAHPIHTEAVSYISGRADPLATLFMLLCFISYVRCLRSEDTRLYILMLASYALGLLSRENSLILPALLLLYHFAFKERIRPKQFLSILAICFLYILLRLTALRALLPHLGSPTTIFERTPGFLIAITNYLRLLMLPVNLHMDYGQNLFQFNDPKAIFGALVLFSLVAYALIVRKSNGFVFFCIAWFVIALLPSSNLYPLNAYMAEHWLYLPSLGFFLLLSKGLSYLYSLKNVRIAALIFMVALSTFYGGLTIRQNNYWKEPVDFYERTLEYAPDNARTYSNLGMVYYEMGKREEAITLYKKAVELDPTYAKVHNNIGFTYYDIGRNKEAIASYKKAIELKADFAHAYYNLGIVYYDEGRKQEAIDLYRKTLAINPDFAKAYHNLGLIYYEIGKTEEAIASYKKAIELKADFADAYNNLSVIYFSKKQYRLAVKYCDRAIERGGKIDPGFLRLLEPYRQGNKRGYKK